MAKTVATILGIVFILVGLAGFLDRNLLGAHLSAAHNIIHLVTGAASLYLGLAGSLSATRMFCIAFGAVYLLLAVVGFLLGSGDDRMLHIIPNRLAFGTMDHIFHVLMGGIYLIAGLMTRADRDGVVGTGV